MFNTSFGRCIDASFSNFKVYENRWYRWIVSNDGMMQSMINRRHPERPYLGYITPLIKILRNFPGDMCIFGLGGAGVLHAISPYMENHKIVAVDNSEEIIAIAHKYFQIDKLNNLLILHQSALDFVNKLDDKLYKLLVIDLYDGHDYPAECSSEAFITQCQALLIPGGVMVVNLLLIQEKWQFVQLIRTKFNLCTLVVTVPETFNTLVFAFNLPSAGVFLEKINKLDCIKKMIWDEYWGWVGTV